MPRPTTPSTSCSTVPTRPKRASEGDQREPGQSTRLPGSLRPDKEDSALQAGGNTTADRLSSVWLVRSPVVSGALWTTDGPNLVIGSDNGTVLPMLPAEAFTMIYLDPPFNTGKTQRRETLRTVRSENGNRVGFKGQTYESVREGVVSYSDTFFDYWSFLEPRLEQAWRLLARDGTLYLHLDYREVHYAKVFLDAMFGRACFLNEIVWAYDYGARSKRKWPTKHDNILVYVKDPESYYYDGQAVDREPYMAPGLVTAEKAERGKLPTDVWWHTIVSPTGKEKTGYPTQKPEGIIRRMVQASSRPDDWVLDFFAGSGTLGAVAEKLDRRYVLVDSNAEAMAVMRKRLGTRLGLRETVFLDSSEGRAIV
jgi:site-specific DNA-methyltransferase (adenine-specific)